MINNEWTTQDFAPVIAVDWQTEPYLRMDFGPSNAELNRVNLNDSAAFADYVFKKLKEVGARFGVGGYNEHRVIYERSAHFQQTDQPRCIHLGVDIWTAATTPVHAPAAGVVHSFRNNSAYGDYGPTIVLQHRHFYTLYGHLTVDSLDGLYEGMAVAKGQEIARIGDYPTNGDWPAHLHFQIITDMMGQKGDFPGVCSLQDRAKYLELCPDPNLVLGIERTLS